MFISQAFAQTTEAVAQVNNAPVPDGTRLILQIVLIFIVLYFLLLRPQQKRLKEHQLQLNSIVKGSQIIVNGLQGTVTAVKDDVLTVEIAKGVEVSVLRDYVSQVVKKEEKDNNKNSKKK